MNQSEKMEIISLVEQSAASVKETLQELGINRSTFYQWYKRYLTNGFDGLADPPHRRTSFQKILAASAFRFEPLHDSKTSRVT